MRAGGTLGSASIACILSTPLPEPRLSFILAEYDDWLKTGACLLRMTLTRSTAVASLSLAGSPPSCSRTCSYNSSNMMSF